MNSFRIKDLDGEEWENVRGFPLYLTSNRERIKRKAYERFCKNGMIVFFPEKIMKQQLNNGYYTVTLTNGEKPDKRRKALKVHRIIATAFLDNPDNLPLVNHLSEVKTDNRVENLAFSTAKENSNWGTLKERQSAKKKGVEFTEEHKKHLSQAMKGNTNRKGKKNSKKHNSLISKSHRKAVICDGKKFSSIKSAATYYDYNYRTFANWVEGKRQMPEKFKSMGLRYLDD